MDKHKEWLREERANSFGPARDAAERMKQRFAEATKNTPKGDMKRPTPKQLPPPPGSAA